MSLLKELQDCELEMLKEVINICNKHNLKYFLLGGSCLGAVRHKGFIPWDDDIDIGLPRDDYEKLLQIAPTELSERYFLQIAMSDKNYPLGFAKIRNSNTTFIETWLKNVQMNHGVYIDIFPLDGYSVSKKDKLLFKLYDKRIACAMYFKKYTFKHLLSKCVFSILLPNYKKCRDKKDRIAQKNNYNDVDIVANFYGNWKEKEIMPKSFFGNGIIGEFEGIQVILPEQYDRYLTQVYGDYMQLPPEEKRVGHHYTEVIDLERSYLHYIKRKGDKK